jgi:hypothetical protein
MLDTFLEDCQPSRENLSKIGNHQYANKVTLNESQMIAFGYFGPVSLVTGLILIYLYVRRTALRRPPGMLIFWQCVAQTCLDVSWTATGVNYYYL